MTARLHETLAQDLAVIGFRLDELISDSSLSNEQRSQIREIRLSIVEIARRFRDVIYLTNYRNRQALTIALTEILVGLQSDIDLSYPLLKPQEESLLNEALVEMAHNAIRHSGAKNFTISFVKNELGLELTISDDGQGLSPVSQANLGLRVIDQSLRAIGCNYQCSTSNQGTKFTIQIPDSIIDSVKTL